MNKLMAFWLMLIYWIVLASYCQHYQEAAAPQVQEQYYVVVPNY
jgi:hypothetical protein